jgi:cellulose synthase (UDP-forming)
VAPAPDPGTTLDVLIPVAGEPLALVAATIATAKAIRWPHNVIVCNDNLISGKGDWQAVEALCRREGVYCLTRTTGARGKAGNLNHALRRIRADAVLVIDADHQVVPHVAQELLGWLRHEDVAFVCTPQEFVDSARDALNPTDSVFYRGVQAARDRRGLAFSTGNGALYRREALVRIGGFSEWTVVEDLHTSIRLHAAGWSSVFHPRPVSVGLAPRTAAEYGRQRLRWATDSLRILRFDPPWRRRDLSRWAKLHYSHTVLSHLVAMCQLGFLLGPPAWIVGRLSLMTDASWQDQALHIGPWLIALATVLVWWGGARGAFRSIRLATAFLPAVFWAAAWRTLSRRSGGGTVTVKANQPRFSPLVGVALILPLGLVATLVWGLFDPRAGGSDLSMGWAALLTVISIGPMLQLGYRRFWPGLAQAVVVVSSVALAAGSVATARFGWDAPGGLYQSFRADPATASASVEANELGGTVVVGPAVPPPSERERTGAMRPVGDLPRPATDAPLVSLAAAEGIYVGFTSDALPFDLSDVDRWATATTEPQIVHWYQQWGSGESRFRGDWLAEVAASGRIPMISWEAWAKPDGSFRSPDQDLGNMADIAAGVHDDYIDAWAEASAAYGDPILLRPFHEMNGFWYPWSVGVNDNTAADYVAGWRHVVDRFERAGAHNVSFVWSVNTLSSFEAGRGIESYYPGDDYVDWVATSGFNWDDYDPAWSSWVTAEWVFADTYEVLAGFGKPVMFAEIGTGKNGGDEAAWVADAMDWFASLPELGAIVWFDRSYDGGVDFRLGTGQRAAVATAAEASDSRYLPDLVLVEQGVEAK